LHTIDLRAAARERIVRNTLRIQSSRDPFVWVRVADIDHQAWGQLWRSRLRCSGRTQLVYALHGLIDDGRYRVDLIVRQINAENGVFDAILVTTARRRCSERSGLEVHIRALAMRGQAAEKRAVERKDRIVESTI